MSEALQKKLDEVARILEPILWATLEENEKDE